MSEKKISGISFCIPTYNRPELLEEALDSILSLDRVTVKFEIIVSDDSDDLRTRELIHRKHEGFPQVRYLKNSVNGQFNNLNNLVDNAVYDWIIFLHDDDRIARNFFIEVQKAKFLDNDEIDMFWTGRRLVDGRGDLITLLKATNTRRGGAAVISGRSFFEKMLYETNYNFSGATIAPMVTGLAIKKSIVLNAGLFDGSLRVNGDYLFIFKAMLCSSSIGYINLPLLEYRISDYSERAKPSKDGIVYLEMKRLIEKVLDFTKSKKNISPIQQKICWKSFYSNALNINGPVIWTALHYNDSYMHRLAAQWKMICDISLNNRAIFCSVKSWLVILLSIFPQNVLRLLNKIYYKFFLRNTP